MKLLNETKEIQNLLGEYCKTGKAVTLPGVTGGRLHHYRRLVYNVVKSTMDQAFPIASSSMNPETWDQLVDDFFANHTTRSAQIWKLPLEFYEYHFYSNTADKLKMPYLNDLLYFEWVEIEIHTMQDIAYPEYNEKGDFLLDSIALNPEHQIMQLNYPVHIYSLAECKDKKGQYFVLLFREPETGNVRFMELSVLHAFIMMKINETALPLQSFKGEIASIAAVESEKFLDDYLHTFISDLRSRKMVLGYLK